MNKKIAFITGANRGLGFETARQLAEKGVHVIIGSRTKKNGEESVALLTKSGLEASYLIFDVNQEEDHQRAFTEISKFGKLDILVNNAGIALDSGAGNASSVSSKILRDTFNTNFFSLISLTQTLLPLIKKSEAGRIVNLSSILGSLTLHSDPESPIYDMKAFAYDASKTALNAFTVHLAHELRDTKIKVNSAHPGWVKTAMGGENAPMDIPDGGKTSTELALLPDDGPSGGFFHRGETLPW